MCIVCSVENVNTYWWRVSSTQAQRKYELVVRTKAFWLWLIDVSAHLCVKSDVRATCLLFLKLSSFVECYFARMCDSSPKTKKASVTLRSLHAWYDGDAALWLPKFEVGVAATGSGLYRHTDCPDWHVSCFSSYSLENVCKIPLFCHGCFVPHPFQFSIHQSLYQWTCIKASLNGPYNKERLLYRPILSWSFRYTSEFFLICYTNFEVNSVSCIIHMKQYFGSWGTCVVRIQFNPAAMDVCCQNTVQSGS
jgi:hypothetical protein